MRFDLIALDADDTLWHNEIHYRRGRESYQAILAKYGVEVDELRLNEAEIENLEYYGYGAVGFAVSLAEVALKSTRGEIGSHDLLKLINISKEIISADVELYDGVHETVRQLSESHNLVLITKGNHLHQASKIKRSGLEAFFEQTEIVPEKSPEVYANILTKLDVPARRFMMVGNAMKSDILPVLELGAYAVYIHNDLTWSYENATSNMLPEDRFFEIDSILKLPKLIERLESSD